MEGFVDLRENGETGATGENFWPSFTDIMMVVVMIFMIASTVLILRNWKLVADLRASIEQAHQAQEVARSASAVNDTLEEQLTQAQQENSLLRMKLMQAKEESKARADQLAERQRQLQDAQAQGKQLASDLEASRARAADLDARLQQAATSYGQLETTVAGLKARLESGQARIAELEKDNREQLAEVNRLGNLRTLSQQRLAALQGDFDTLKVKYDKLVKPARTPHGKHVVEVRYEVVGGAPRISLRDTGDNDFSILSRAQMDARLGALKARYPGKLYVKIIIPDNSGLSYSEAWRFTNDVLARYDYYQP